MKTSRRFTLALLAGDFACVYLAFNAAAWFWLPNTYDISNPLTWSLLLPAGLMALAFALIDGYDVKTDYLSLDYVSQHLLAVMGALLATVFFTYVAVTDEFALQTSRVIPVLAFTLLAPTTLAGRRFLCLRRAAVRHAHAVVFAGDETSAAEFAQECARMNFASPLRLVAASKTSPNDPRPSLAEIVAEIETGQSQLDAIVLRESSLELPEGLPQRLVQLHFAGIPTYTLELFHEVVWRKIPLYRINQTWLFQEGFTLAREPLFERCKRLSDIALAATVLLLALPLVTAAALAIKCDDRGPVFFRQIRIGQHGRPFTLYKLRTMRASAGGSRYTAAKDPRITRIGSFLRSSRLDELPQLWNVLRGEMSMIGPRAEWDVLVSDYQKNIPCYHFRHLVRPGITGWAQVNYPYGANLEDTLRKLEFDLYYIRHYSFRLDAAIVLKTIHVMLFRKGGR